MYYTCLLFVFVCFKVLNWTVIGHDDNIERFFLYTFLLRIRILPCTTIKKKNKKKTFSIKLHLGGIKAIDSQSAPCSPYSLLGSMHACLLVLHVVAWVRTQAYAQCILRWEPVVWGLTPMSDVKSKDTEMLLDRRRVGLISERLRNRTSTMFEWK